jgi:hypothetical protein
MKEKSVAFGDQYRTNENSLVVVIGISNGVCTANVLEVNGHEALGYSGTPSVDNLIERIEVWSLERILNALATFADDAEPRGKLYDLIRNEAKQKPIIIS